MEKKDGVYAQVVGALLQPSRMEYSVANLPYCLGGDRESMPITRLDEELALPCGTIIQMSSYLYPGQSDAVVYLHTHSGMRLEGLEIARGVVERGIGAVLFDFRGNGLSSGEWVSFGWHEAEDLSLVQSADSGPQPPQDEASAQKCDTLGSINGGGHLYFPSISKIQREALKVPVSRPKGVH